MKRLVTIGLALVLGLLTACTSPTEEAGLKEVVNLYGGTALLKKGTGVSTTATDLQGNYLAIDLASSSPSKFYNDLQIPASNCAYLVYNRLRPDERTSYNYFKINIQDSASSHSYTFSPADLELASRAGGGLTTLMANLQQEDYPAIAASFDPAALGKANPDSIPANMRSIGKQLAPFSDYTVHGFGVAKASLAGRTVPIVRFLVSVAHGQARPVSLVAYINPNSRSQQFLVGLELP